MSKDDALSTLHSYDSSGDMSSEIPVIVNSAYKNVSAHGSKFYEDIDKTADIVSNI